MKALSIDRPGLAQIVDRPRPVAGPGEVLLQVAFAGLCGTDLSAFLGKNPLVEYPRVIGHEISGQVVDIGPGVDGAWRGVKAAVSPYKNCGACPACRLGRPNACRDNQTLGVQRDGALAEYAAVPASRLVPSRTLPLDVLALVEPFSIGMHAVQVLGIELNRRQRVLDFVRHLPRHFRPRLESVRALELAALPLELSGHPVEVLHQTPQFVG